MAGPQPDNVCDTTLEYAAQLVEESSLRDWRGAMAKRKRQREDAELRRQARAEMRIELADYIRAMKARPDRTPLAVLAHLAELDGDDHAAYVRDAWPLAWKGWVSIHASVRCDSNCLPPEQSYRIELTDAGREALAARPTPLQD